MKAITKYYTVLMTCCLSMIAVNTAHASEQTVQKSDGELVQPSIVGGEISAVGSRPYMVQLRDIDTKKHE